MQRLATCLILAMTMCGCATSRMPPSAGTGPNPELPPPQSTLIPTFSVAKPTGWPAGTTPVAAEGMVVNAFATDLEHPRWIYVLPNGDVLVAETNSPPRPDDGKGIKGWVMKMFRKWTGAASPSANRITLLRDTNNDGVADLRTAFLENLYSPFGMALVGNDFYVANTDAIVRFPYQRGQTQITAGATKVVDLPAGRINHHWTKSLIANRDGSRLYAGIGSNSNIGENGMDKEEGRAAIWIINQKTGEHRIFASGIRNPVGLAWEPVTGALWAVANERDELGNDLPPDYLTSVRDGGFYGWPYSYFGQHVDPRVKPQRPDLVAKSIAPDYALGTHVAPLGLAHSGGNSLPARFKEGMFVGEHGSWNRKPRAGYKVVFVPFSKGKPEGQPLDVLTGFVVGDDALGRPVGVALDKQGALLVVDDVGNVIWRVTSAKSSRP